jgi:hypothetical protein
MQHTRVVINMKNNTALIFYDPHPSCDHKSPPTDSPVSYLHTSKSLTAQPMDVVFIDDSYVGGQAKVLKERYNGCQKKSKDLDRFTKCFSLKPNTL